MGNKAYKKREIPGLIIDVVQAAIGLIAATLLVLDSTGLMNIPWLKNDVASLTFAAICILIVVSAVERRFTLRSLEDKVEDKIAAKLDNIEHQTKMVNDTLSGSVSVDAVMSNRLHYIPLEHRLTNVKEVCFSGQSLVAVVSGYYGWFLKLAKDGCKFKFLIEEPSHCDEKVKEEISQTLRWLAPLKNATPSQVEIRHTSEVLHYSLLLVDSNDQSGRIQVEFYCQNVSTSERPHINLLPARDPKWYQLYKAEFESLWNDPKIKKM